MLLLSVLLLSAATIASASEQSTTDVPNNDTTTEANMGSTVQITSTDGSLMTFTPSSNADGSNSTTTTPSNSTTETTVPPSMELQRNSSGRAINFSISEDGEENNSSEVIKGSLQDLSLDDIDISSIMTTMPDFMPNFTISQTNVTPTAMTSTTAASESGVICMEGDALYRMGETFNRGCDETCKCDAGGQVSCMPRCSEPLFRRGSRKDDPMCFERATNDPCCATLVCGQDTELEPLEVCHYKNESYQRGEMFNEGCESLCSCGEAGKITCKPRCPVVAHNSSDQCVALLDPTDACCTVIRCDVTLGDHDGNESGPEDHASQFLQLLAAEVVNGSAVKLEVVGDMPANITIEKSTDQKSWKPQESDGLIVVGLEPGNTYYLRANAGGVVSNAVQVITPLAKEPSSDMTSHAGGCQYKGMNYSIGQEFNDGCEAYCICSETGLECAKIDCPTDFGLDVIDSHCLEWDMQPNGFVAIPPKCCPDEIKCKNNGSCEYIGETYNNWEEIPTSVTGCEKRCLCKFGNVTCETVCPPLSATPPVDIRCQPHEAILDHQPGDNCCLYWMCPSVQHPGPEHGITTLPHGYYKFPNIIGSHHPDEMLIETLEPLDPRTVRIVLSVPPVLVGLHGHVELRYTADKQNNDISTWEQRVLEPSDDLIAVSRIEFFIDGLQPATEYRIKASIILRDLHNSPSSAIMTVQTPPEVPSTTLPPIIDVFPHLSVMKVNTTWITVTWHKFDDFKRNLIDGIQLRYKEVDDKVYSTTPLIHRAVTEYTIEGLKPNTMYEIGILFIPFPMQTTELQANSSIKVNTTEGQDMYKFDVQVEIYNIKATTVEVNWTGVPYPVDKYVNIFRAIYQSDSGKEDFSAFKVAKRDSLSTTLIKDLIPGTRYRLWLEVYLTNGRIKKSNVQDFSTKPGSISTAESSQQGKLESSPTPVNQAGDYYSPLVAVSILAALAILATLILLLILMRKHSQNKAAISTSRKSQSAYDNPSYKTCEDPSPVNGNGTAKTSEPS